jgi:hypothetical protein
MNTSLSNLKVNIVAIASTPDCSFLMRVFCLFAALIVALGPLPAYADTEIGGTIAPNSLRLVAPASFIPGKAFLVRVDLLNAQGQSIAACGIRRSRSARM